MKERDKQSDHSNDRQNRFMQELWGIIFLSFGLLNLIALVSFFIDPGDNILGPYFGTNLASGLLYLFGAIPSFVFPFLALYIGLGLMRRNALPVRFLVYSAVITVEVCTILAIHKLPLTVKDDFTFSSNAIGNVMTFLMHYIFGTHKFGPYFLFSLAFFLTVCALFRIYILDMVVIIGRFFKAASVRLWKGFIAALRSPRQPETKEVEKERQGKEKKEEEEKKNDKKKISEEKKKQPEQNAVSSEKTMAMEQEGGQSEEMDESEQLLEQELAAFRAKKNQPVKILIPEEQAEEMVQNLENEVLGNDEEDIAIVDPSFIQDGSMPEEAFEGVAVSSIPKEPLKPYILPSPDIIPDPPAISSVIDRLILEENSRILEKTLLNFGVEGKVVNISPGPVVTRYEIELAPGVKISKVVNLHDDLSMAVGGKKIRIEAPIPGKAAVGIELPNEEMQLVSFKSILVSDAFTKSKAKLPIVIGKSISGLPYVTDITKMPHLLIAGQTGSGKSVAINAIICSFLMTKKPEELRLILIDPKKVELNYYEEIPHLLAPVVTESKEAVKALQWGTLEMTRRYRLLAKVGARNVDSFNQKVDEKSIKEGAISESDNKRLPFIVIIVDELADLMMTASRDVEALIQRISQLARAVGIHLIVSTQRPSVDIITGLIKANLTSRIAFRTIQSTDSRTILGFMGAEKLLGRGDMLFLRNGAPDIERYHGAFISEEDVERIVADVKSQKYEMDRIESFEAATAESGGSLPSESDSSDTARDGRDEKFEEAARLIVSTGLGSTSLLQRRLKLGYARAGRLMDELYEAGIVGPQEGSKAREVLITPETLEDMLGH